MATRALKTPHDKRGGPCPLTIDEVYAILSQQRVPLTTSEVAEFCASRHTYPNITTDRVRDLLTWLERRNRVLSWPGTDESLADRVTGWVPSRKRYWAIAS